MIEVAGPPLESESGIGALTLGGLLNEVCTSDGSRQAVAFEGDTITYDELLRETRLLARSLLGSGVGKGTRVALLMGNRPEWVVAAFAVGMVGGVLVPMNTYLETTELEYVLRHSDAAVVLLQAELAGHRYLDAVNGLDLPFLRRVCCLGTDTWDELLADATGVPDDQLHGCEAEVTPFDDALIVYTSGTTARPKGVVHAHRAATLQSWRFARELCLDPDVRTWSAFPFFWTAGFCMVMGAGLAAGGSLVLQEHFEPGEALRLLEVERVTTAHAWPHQLAALEDHPDWPKRDLSALRHVDPLTSFARHPSVGLVPDWSPRAAYGLTETFTIISSVPADTPAPDREGHHGAILAGNVVRIVDDEIAVKGPTLMRGYAKVPPEACFDRDGFFHTGDAGYVDADGHLCWTGRLTGMIKSGGANVSPVEIETELLDLPALKAAVAVGMPDERLGELVVVAAVAHDGADVDEASVRAFLRGRIASYKIPRRVVFFRDDEFELTGNAKIRVEDLRSRVAARLSVPSEPGR
jgi:fatty-acyl-CoA synthase